jgi:hypothetical protein
MVALIAIVAGRGGTVHGCGGMAFLFFVCVRRLIHRSLGLDVVVLSDPDPNTLVGKTPRQKCRLAHSRESFARVYCHRVRGNGHHMDNLALNQFKECEAKAEASLDSGRHVTKDKKAAVRVVDVF